MSPMESRLNTLLLLVTVSMTLQSPLVPTNWGTAVCSYMPFFQLTDFQPADKDMYMQTYSLSDLDDDADVTIVGLYFGDALYCQEIAEQQDILGQELRDRGLKVNNFAINYYAPLYCVLSGECVRDWWDNFNVLLPWKADNCEGYIAGCPPDSEALQFSKWQGALANFTSMPIFQDTDYGWIWDEFGGREGDIFIYDKQDRLYAYLCDVDSPSEEYTCTLPMIGGLVNETNYDAAFSLARKAAKSNGTERCWDWDYEYDDDGEVEEVGGGAGDGDGEGDDESYYYYYSPEEKGYYDLDDDDEERVYFVDDTYYYDDFTGYDDDKSLGFTDDTIHPSVKVGVARRHHTHRIIHKVPSYVFAAAFAIFVTVVTFAIILCRWRYLKTRNSIERDGATFIRLATDEEDATAVGTPGPGGVSSYNDTEAAGPQEPTSGSQLWRGKQNDPSYGSL